MLDYSNKYDGDVTEGESCRHFVKCTLRVQNTVLVTIVVVTMTHIVVSTVYTLNRRYDSKNDPK